MFKGSLPALVTPFKNGRIDSDALAGLVERQVREGAARLETAGMLGVLQLDLDGVIQAKARHLGRRGAAQVRGDTEFRGGDLGFPVHFDPFRTCPWLGKSCGTLYA